MREPREHLKTLQRRVDFLKSRDHKNSFDHAELGSLEWALINLQPERKPLTPEWIWTWLMDWCKRNGTSPASYNSLFKMVADARAIEAKHNIKENT